MKRIIGLVRDVIKFITEDIWSKNDSEYNSRLMRISARQLKIFIFTARSYGQDQLVIRSAALTFYTLMALVPLAAIVFGIAKGFMFETRINEYLYSTFPRYTDLITQIIEFANAMLERTKGGILATIGFLILLWAVMKVFINIESSFNHIWEVRKNRRITRKVSDYLSVLLVAPIFWLVSNNATEVIGQHIEYAVKGTLFAPVVDVISLIIPFLVMWIMLSVVYFVMPNTKVKFGAAFRAGVITGTAFHIFQIFYFYSQSMLSGYNAIYGSFAALPLFLIWMHISWQIIMFGAELSFGYQNIEKYEFERESYRVNYDYRRKVTLLVMHRIAQNFSKGAPPIDSDQLSELLNVSVRLVRDALFDLEQANLIVSIDDEIKKTNRYLPLRDVSKMRVYDVIRAVETSGASCSANKECVELKEITERMNNIEKSAKNSHDNVLLMDIGSDEEV